MAYKIATGLEAVCDVALIKTYCCSNVAWFEMSQTAILLESMLKGHKTGGSCGRKAVVIEMWPK